MAHRRQVRFFDPLALAELNRALKWQRRYRWLRKLVLRLQTERRGHVRLLDVYERQIARYERELAALSRAAHWLYHIARRRQGRSWDDVNLN